MESQQNDNHVGKRLRLLRNRAGLTQEGLAERVQVSPQQIQRYEMGTNRITVDKLEAIADALGLKASAFFSDGIESLPLSDDERGLLEDYRKISDMKLRESIAVITKKAAGFYGSSN